MTSGDSRKRSAERTKLESEASERDEPRAYRFRTRTLARAASRLTSTSGTPLELLQPETSKVQTIEEPQAKSTVAPPAQEQPLQIPPLQPQEFQTAIGVSPTGGSQSLQQTTQSLQQTSQPTSLQSQPASNALRSTDSCSTQSTGLTEENSAKQLSASSAYSTSPLAGEPNSEQQSQRIHGTSTTPGNSNSRAPRTTSVTSRSIQTSNAPSTPLPSPCELDGVVLRDPSASGGGNSRNSQKRSEASAQPPLQETHGGIRTNSASGARTS